jgi:ferrochelatase
VLDELERLAAEGERKVLVAAVGFVSDHLEILWDIDVEAREKAGELGLELARTESLNDDPLFIRALAGLVEKVRAVPSGA